MNYSKNSYQNIRMVGIISHFFLISAHCIYIFSCFTNESCIIMAFCCCCWFLLLLLWHQRSNGWLIIGLNNILNYPHYRNSSSGCSKRWGTEMIRVPSIYVIRMVKTIEIYFFLAGDMALFCRSTFIAIFLSYRAHTHTYLRTHPLSASFPLHMKRYNSNNEFLHTIKQNAPISISIFGLSTFSGAYNFWIYRIFAIPLFRAIKIPRESMPKYKVQNV